MLLFILIFNKLVFALILLVVSTYKEPLRGWINNIYGATGIFYGAGIGLLRVLYCDENTDGNIVPVDMCINGLIASAWDTAHRFQNARDENDNFEMPIYNYESTNDKVQYYTLSNL